MDKRGFYDRLDLAAARAFELAADLVLDELPRDLCFTIRHSGIKAGTQGPPGTLKFLGGRFLTLEELTRVPARRAAKLLWVDGKVPAWINIGVRDYTVTHTELEIDLCANLLPADEYRLPTDLGCVPANEICPFRIRGPFVPPRWRSVESDGKFHLMRRQNASQSHARERPWRA